MNQYKIVGILLCIVGYVLISLFLFILNYIPLIAISISVMILSLVCLSLSTVKDLIFKISNRLIISIAILFAVINSFLILLDQGDIAIYYILNSIFYLVIVLMFSDINLKAKIVLNRIDTLIFSGFVITLVFKLMTLMQ
jgi:hypothetical protein